MSWFSKLNPVPSFPPYTGRYTVGSCDVEIPVTELEAANTAPDDSIPTVAFRVFYPSEPTPSSQAVRWMPNPQRGYTAAMARFLGANSALSEVFGVLPQLSNYITIPVQKNAPLLPPDTTLKRWPVVMFSHGLGGNRNSYSHICGGLASHGAVVVACEYRDGSEPISYIRATEKAGARTVHYKQMSMQPSLEVYQARDEMLRIRLWETGLILDALTKIDEGKAPVNLNTYKKQTNTILNMFCNQLDVHRPGKISFAGHSFGATTVVQLCKSTYWRVDQSVKGFSPLFLPSSDSSIAKQITPNTPCFLLDLWCLPLRSPSTRWLWERPLPCYDSHGPGGTVILSVLSEAFFKWNGNLQDTKRVVSENPASDNQKQTKPPPHIFYPATSAHVSQSDFGILFPWATKKFLKAEEPERTMTLNIRAILQVMRNSGIEVADTSRVDLEETEDATLSDSETGQDWRILSAQREVRGWIPVSVGDVDPQVSIEQSSSQEPSDKIQPAEVTTNGHPKGATRRGIGSWHTKGGMSALPV